MGDKGYQGIKKYHNNSLTPKKKSRGSRLSKEDKRQNKQLAQQRIIIEHINRKLKIFRILSEKYRNRRKRFGLRFNLIAGLYRGEISEAVICRHLMAKRLILIGFQKKLASGSIKF